MAAEINQPAGYAPDSYEPGRTGWTGWIAFAGGHSPSSRIEVLVIWALTAHGREMRAP
jgi:hypothetical protein